MNFINKKIFFFSCITLFSLTTHAQQSNTNGAGKFITIKGTGDFSTKAYVTGPENSSAGIILVHDFFGISKAAKESAERLGAMGYRTVAVDLYNGKTAMNNDDATVLMQAKDSTQTARILGTAIDYLKKPGRKLAAIGFSAGGIDAMNATLMEPELFKGTIIIYGGNYDKIDQSRLSNLKSPVFSITGTLDSWPVDAALNFFAKEKGKQFEMYFYPGADHGYAQPLFSGGKNYNPEATRVTWLLIKDFLSRNVKLK